MELKRNLIIVDVEADGPCPGLYSMVCFGAVCVNDIIKFREGKFDQRRQFYGACAPLSVADGSIQYQYDPGALAVSGFTREQHEAFRDPQLTMIEFKEWLTHFDRPVFVSDNPAFDWQFINYYFHLYALGNPFGFSARRIGDFYAGLNHRWDDQNNWKKLRETSHTHNPVDDAKGNAEALITILGRSK